MKGAVLLIGSLLWENEENALKGQQGRERADWWKNLDMDNKLRVKVPIRYGRKSRTKSDTYTMVFSTSVESLGTAFIVPYKEEVDDFGGLKKLAIDLSYAEGISSKKYPDRLHASWGAIGIKFNQGEKTARDNLKKEWHRHFKGFDSTQYKIGSELPAITKNGELNFDLEIPNDIDFVFATPVVPNVSAYPTVEKVIEAVLESNPKYDTYVKENRRNGIRVANDEEIIRGIS